MYCRTFLALLHLLHGSVSVGALFLVHAVEDHVWRALIITFVFVVGVLCALFSYRATLSLVARFSLDLRHLAWKVQNSAVAPPRVGAPPWKEVIPLDAKMENIIQHLERLRPFLPDAVSIVLPPNLFAPSLLSSSSNDVFEEQSSTNAQRSLTMASGSHSVNPPTTKRVSISTPASVPIEGASQDFATVLPGSSLAVEPDKTTMTSAGRTEAQQPPSNPISSRKHPWTELVMSRITVMVLQVRDMESVVNRPIEFVKLLTAEFHNIVIETTHRHHGAVLSLACERVVLTWNAQIPQTCHQALACDCARDLARMSKIPALERRFDVHVDIAITSGRAACGTSGTSKLQQQCVLGGLLHLSSQLSDLCYLTGARILLTSGVKDTLPSQYRTKLVDYVTTSPFTVKGDRTVIYELCPDDSRDISQDAINTYKEGFLAFVQHDYKHAEALLTTYVKDMSPGDPQGIRLLSLARYYNHPDTPYFLPEPYSRYGGWHAFELPASSVAPPEGVDMVPTLPTSMSLASGRSSVAADERLRRDILSRFPSMFLPTPSVKSYTSVTPGGGPYVDPFGALPNTFSRFSLSNDQSEGLDPNHLLCSVVSSPAVDISGRSTHRTMHSTTKTRLSGQRSPPAMGSTGYAEVDTTFNDRKNRVWQRSVFICGEGAYGKVYLGMQEDGSLVAMKVHQLPSQKPNKQQMEDILLEVGVLSKLRHPNIVGYVSSAVLKNHLVIIMEYIACGSLADIMRHFESIQVTSVRRYARDILRGLAYLHQNNICHRDIKPANVLLDSTGQCKLSDFGTSSHVHTLLDNDTTTKPVDNAKPPAYAGTPVYMPPESFAGNSSEKSDVWSFGITLLELVLGRLPFPDHKLQSLHAFTFWVTHSADAGPTIPEDFPPQMKDFCSTCCRRDPVKRPTAAELLGHPFLVF